jgi:diguanylate cyclase (GGDEF)-like protein/PAS domain S-box-containing protein
MDLKEAKAADPQEPARDDLMIAPEPEPAFDELASLAAWSVGAAAGIIALQDGGPLWLKATVGLPAGAEHQALELCARTAEARKPLVIANAGAGPLRFFAGIPLVMPYGRLAGVVAVADVTPRELDARHEQRLQAVAGQVLSQLELRRILTELAQTIGERHDLELALRESEERYRELFENANDVVYTHDLTEHFTSINAAGERITGYTREEVLNMNFAQVIAPEFLELARQMMARKLAGDPPRIYEVDILAKDGHRVSLELSTRVIQEAGKPVGIQGIARDVSERRKAQAELREANDKLHSWIAELEQRNRESAILSDMGDLLQICMTPREAFPIIGRAARDLFLHYTGAVMILDNSRNVVEAMARWGDNLQGEESFAPEECWALRRGRAHMVESETVGPLCHHAGANFRGSTLCVPMMAQGEALGILHVQGTAGGLPSGVRVPVTEAVERLGITFAEHIALSLANLKLRETLRHQSIRDPLTGLFNRRFLEESILRELQRAGRKQRPVGVIMLDVDHFKQFNDTHGHQAGDALLREIGALLQRHTRGDDIACRYGGEEFTVILPEAPLEVTRQRAERIRLEAKNLVIPSDPGRVTSLSCGVSAFPDHGSNAMALLRAADRALYRAKEAGRDRVMVAEGLPGSGGAGAPPADSSDPRSGGAGAPPSDSSDLRSGGAGAPPSDSSDLRSGGVPPSGGKTP